LQSGLERLSRIVKLHWQIGVVAREVRRNFDNRRSARVVHDD
jgi:hypothetical protein